MRSAIWLNARKRRGKKIRRHYNHASTIVKEERHTKCPDTVEWQEELRYLPMPKREIVETKNNIGLLSIGKDHVQNTLLRMKGGAVKEIHFERVDIDTNSAN